MDEVDGVDPVTTAIVACSTNKVIRTASNNSCGGGLGTRLGGGAVIAASQSHG